MSEWDHYQRVTDDAATSKEEQERIYKMAEEMEDQEMKEAAEKEEQMDKNVVDALHTVLTKAKENEQTVSTTQLTNLCKLVAIGIAIMRKQQADKDFEDATPEELAQSISSAERQFYRLREALNQAVEHAETKSDHTCEVEGCERKVWSTTMGRIHTKALCFVCEKYFCRAHSKPLNFAVEIGEADPPYMGVLCYECLRLWAGPELHHSFDLL